MRNKKVKRKKEAKSRRFTLKAFLIVCAAAALLVFAGIQAFNLLYYRLYRGYTPFLKNYEVSPGTPLFLSESNDFPDMVLVTQSANLKLYTNLQTAEIAVYDKRNGSVTYSNPPGADADENATALNKSYLKSQLIVDYYSPSRTLGTYNTYDHSVARSQLEYEGIENGIRYIYTIGDFTSETGIVPVYISKERLDYFTGQMPEREANYVAGRYHPWALREGFMELNDGAIRAAQLRNITEYLEGVGYTEEDFAFDMTEAGAEDKIPMSFEIALEYRLYDDYLEAALPTKLINEYGGGMIYRVQMLRYMGAAGLTEDGYMLLPNGSGSLVYFNNGKEKVENYSQFVYGIDPLIADYVVTEQTQKARLPVFGISRPENSIFASIEDCDALAMITAYVSKSMNSYNFVYPTFLLRGGERLSMFGSTDLSAELPIVEKEIYDVNCRVNYYFLTDEYQGYSGMACFYRQKLINEGVFKDKTPSGDIPFFMDITGGVMGTGFFLGKQYYKTIPMTTFAQAADISSELNRLGIRNQIVNLEGWFNRGYYHDVPNRINVLSNLGGKKGLSYLTRSVENTGGKVYGDVAFQSAAFTTRYYNWQLETSRYYGAGYVAFFGAVNPATNMQTSSMGYTELMYDLLSPKFLNRYVDKFSKKVSNIDITGIGLRDLGDVLHSDKKRTELIDREQAKHIVIAQLNALSETGKSLLIQGGNLYSLKYADALINTPLSHNPFFMVDDEVPFYQMVTHGYIDYAGDSINLNGTQDNIDIILKLIENGASPHYTFTWEASGKLKYTGLNRYRSATYANWRDDAVFVYNEVNTILRRVSGSCIVKHEIVSQGVTMTYYDNGIVIAVDKNTKIYEMGEWR